MSILAKICADKLKHVENQRNVTTQAEIEAKAGNADQCRGFLKAIQAKVANNNNALIAEIKKASPSYGVIREDFNPGEIATAYERGGAACLSVLTDVPYFKGCDENLLLARENSSLPILRKDFMLDTYQVYEARAFGADCILLIMAAISDAQAAELEDVALSLGMDVLVEVHDAQELERAMNLKSKLIGINNRNLKTLKVDIATTIRLATMIPQGYTIVCESGITANSDIKMINKAGVYSFLVGETLMLKKDIEYATKLLLDNL